MSKFASLLFFVFGAPGISLAMPADLACKLSNRQVSAQMHSKTLDQEGQTKTFLIFDDQITWTRDLSQFEVVYSSGYSRTQQLILVGHAIAANGQAQTVEIKLEPASEGSASVRYGIVRAGDFQSRWTSSLGKYQTYDIQCFNF